MTTFQTALVIIFSILTFFGLTVVIVMTYMKNLILITIIITSIVIVSCNETSEENNPTVPQSVIDNSLNLFDGEVIETGTDEEDGIKLIVMWSN